VAGDLGGGDGSGRAGPLAGSLRTLHARPGPLSAEEDAVYQFVTMLARGYLGEPVWNPGGTATMAGGEPESTGDPVR
jgi:hypothetical protein